VFAAIDGKHSIDEILRGAAGAMSDEQVRGFISQLWEYDQIVLVMMTPIRQKNFVLSCGEVTLGEENG